MLSKTHRFHGYNSLRHVYRQGAVARTPHMSLKYLANPRTASYRAAVVVSRKVHKAAVVRNRIRRRVYEALRTNEALLRPGNDLVFTAFSDQLAELPASEVQTAVGILLKKANLLNGAASPSPRGIVEGKETLGK